MNRNLEQIKQDYQNIKVPDTLKSQVETAIAQAKKDIAANAVSEKSNPGNIRKSRQNTTDKTPASIFRFPFVKAAAGVAAAAFLLVILANSGPSVSHAMEQIPILGVIAKIVTFREYNHQEKNMEANIKVPEIEIKDEEGKILEDATEKLNSNIQSYTDEIIAAYEADRKASGGEDTQAVDLDYEVVTDNDTLFSLRFHQTVTQAGAAQMEKIYHIDKQTGKMIALKDLFQDNADYQTPIYENIRQQMKEQMAQDESKIYWVDSDMPESEFLELPDTVNFYVNESGKLVIVFDEYQVAPGYMGVVTFEIPTEIVKDIVKDGYLL
ncbi:hypothetical protein C806_02451 [Lachnospiraceae bacterium 3-1]|nr:hypothetical protein C806_02451 [Lachnospiraceae bacterium 3-1]